MKAPILRGLLLAVLATGSTRAQPVEWTGTAIADVHRGVALAPDQDGGLYVAHDRRISRIDSSGNWLGPVAEGASGDSFRPGGFDPTNGLILLVTDPEGGRLLRFAREGRFLEAFTIGQDVSGSGRSVFNRQGVPAGTGPTGRPVDVAETDDGRTFVIDEATVSIRVYDRNRRLLRATGTKFGDELPIDPVSIATDGEWVYVADATLPGIVVLDRFGNVQRWFGAGVEGTPIAVASGPSGIWLLTDRAIHLFNPQGRNLARAGIEAVDDPLDVAEGAGRLYVLTRSRLLVGGLPAMTEAP